MGVGDRVAVDRWGKGFAVASRVPGYRIGGNGQKGWLWVDVGGRVGCG